MIVIKIQGGIGNQLFQYAILVGRKSAYTKCAVNVDFLKKEIILL